MRVTAALIVVWTALFVWQTQLPLTSLRALQLEFGLSPERLSEALDALRASGWPAVPAFGRDAVLPLLSYQFLHGGAVHLLGNVVFFWVFGSRLESRAGSLRFLLFHLTAGVLAGLCQAYLSPDRTAVTIGASGAIAASMSAFMVLYLKSRILLVIPVVVVPVFVEVSSVLLIGLWFALQLGPVQRLFAVGSAEPTAWFAHVGGFLAGFLLLPLVSWPRRAAEATRGAETAAGDIRS